MARVLLLLLIASSAQADRFTTYLAAENWNTEVSPAHGIGLLSWETLPLWSGGRLLAELNTDTLRFGVHGVRISPALEFGLETSAEFGIAGLLPDYFQNGIYVQGRGFWANYFGARAYAKAQIGARTWFELEVGGRRWLFQPIDEGDRATDPALELPPNAWVFEPRLRWTWWNLADDAGWRDRHRFFPRIRGVAAGAELAIDARMNDRPWGARDPEAFAQVDPRNAPDRIGLRASQWLKAGWQLHPRVRTELQERAVFGAGGDDISRERIGGAGPYVTPLLGAPWSGWISEQFVSGVWSWHLEAYEALEIGPMATVVLLTDPDRLGDTEETATLFGVGLLADWRHGPWQVDLRGGWSPSVSDRADVFAYSVWLGGGYQFLVDEE